MPAGWTASILSAPSQSWATRATAIVLGAVGCARSPDAPRAPARPQSENASCRACLRANSPGAGRSGSDTRLAPFSHHTAQAMWKPAKLEAKAVFARQGLVTDPGGRAGGFAFDLWERSRRTRHPVGETKSRREFLRMLFFQHFSGSAVNWAWICRNSPT